MCTKHQHSLCYRRLCYEPGAVLRWGMGAIAPPPNLRAVDHGENPAKKLQHVREKDLENIGW